jgi:hypothetical protein
MSINLQMLSIPFLLFVLSSFFYLDTTPEEVNTITVLDSVIVTRPPTVRGDLYVFMGVMAERESNNTPTVVNRYGYLGKYQFSPKTLWALGRRFKVTEEEFLGTEALQDSAMVVYLQDNRLTIQDLIVRFDGKWYRGIYITESGLLAGAHLVGPSGLRAWLDPTFTITRNGREIRPRTYDGNGTRVQEYIAMFSGYDLDNLN